VFLQDQTLSGNKLNLSRNQVAPASVPENSLHSHQFAAVVIYHAFPRIPYAEQTFPFLFENLHHVSMLSVWNGPQEENIYQGHTEITAYYNRRIFELAEEMSLPYFAVEIEAGALQTIALSPPSKIASVLSARKPLYSKRIRHWFRYPSQGRADWLDCVKMKPEIWSESQISIQTGVTEDRDDFITDTIQAKLGWIAADAANQTITIETRRVEKLDVFLSQELIDLHRPITVIINGRQRHQSLVIESPRTMLEYAYRNWQFNHLPTAKLTFNIRHDRSTD